MYQENSSYDCLRLKWLPDFSTIWSWSWPLLALPVLLLPPKQILCVIVLTLHNKAKDYSSRYIWTIKHIALPGSELCCYGFFDIWNVTEMLEIKCLERRVHLKWDLILSGIRAKVRQVRILVASTNRLLGNGYLCHFCHITILVIENILSLYSHATDLCHDGGEWGPVCSCWTVIGWESALVSSPIPPGSVKSLKKPSFAF